MGLDHAEFSMKALRFEQTPKPQMVLHDFHFLRSQPCVFWGERRSTLTFSFKTVSGHFCIKQSSCKGTVQSEHKKTRYEPEREAVRCPMVWELEVEQQGGAKRAGSRCQWQSRVGRGNLGAKVPPTAL